MLDLSRNNFGSHFDIELSIELGLETRNDETWFFEYLSEVRVTDQTSSASDRQEAKGKFGTLTGCLPVLYADIIPHSCNWMDRFLSSQKTYSESSSEYSFQGM